MEKDKLSRMIDHTILKADATKDEVQALCKEAKEYNFASVCINPSNISVAKRELQGTDVKVCTVIGFPLGANVTEVKKFETKVAIEDGATEVDMVMNIGKLKEEDYDYVLKDIEAVVEAAKGKAIVKVILETCLLNDEEKKVACLLSKKAGANFVKTYTGFSIGGATEEDIRLMRETVGEEMGVKASGGVRTYSDAIKMINAGATRIGASASINIVNKIDSNKDMNY